MSDQSSGNVARRAMPSAAEEASEHVKADELAPTTRPFTTMGSSTLHLGALQSNSRPQPGRKSSTAGIPHVGRLEATEGEFDVRRFILDQKGADPLHQSSLFRAAPFREQQPHLKSRSSTQSNRSTPESSQRSKKLLPKMDLRGSKSVGTLPVPGYSDGDQDRANKANKTQTSSSTGPSVNQQHDEQYDSVSHFYTIERMAESCCHAAQSKNRTWHFLPGSEERSKGNNGGSGNSITGVERPSRRIDLLDLEKCFDSAIQFVNRKNKWDAACSEKMAMIDQDFMSIEARVAQKYSLSTRSGELQLGDADERTNDQDALVKLFFEQKWSDVVLGELEAMLTVSFLEQGVVLRKARIQYAQAFYQLEQLYCERSRDLKQALQDAEKMRQEVQRMSENHHRDTEDTKEHYEAEIQRLHIGFEARKEEMEKKALESRDQMTKMGDTMKTLNTIFRQMREDTEKVKAVELRENYSKLEKKYELCREEIERLRPLIRENQELTQEKEVVEQENEALQERVAKMDVILTSKDETISNLLVRQSDMLAAHELREVHDAERRKRAQDEADEDGEDENDRNAGTASTGESDRGRRDRDTVAVCIRCKQNMKDVLNQGSFADQHSGSAQDTQGSTENGESGMFGQESKKVQEVRTRRIQCLYFRILLPNLRGRRPHKDAAWTFGCMRSILFAKQIDDAMCKRNGGVFPLRIRMPEYVYSWFSPWRSIKDEKHQEELGAGYTDPSGSGVESTPTSRSTLTSEHQQVQADEDRWCLYYGVKALVQEGYLEAKLFLSLLDEKYGEDELVFLLYCYRVLDILIGGRLSWGPLRECVSYEKFSREYERSVGAVSSANRFPKTVWISPYHASLATGVVLSKATESERAALDKKIMDYAVTNLPDEEKPTVFLPPEQPQGGKRMRSHRARFSENADHLGKRDDEEDDPDLTTQQFVDANLWVELMMLEYKEEQAHRRAAIRLMFQTATSAVASVGAGSRLSETRQLAALGGLSAATMDMEQFRIMIRTLNDEIPSFMVAMLFRNTYMKGNGAVNFDAFMDVAESAQFFSSCMRLQSPASGLARLAGEPTSPASAASCTSSRAADMVAKFFVILQSELESTIEALPMWTRSMTDYLSYEITSALQDTDGTFSDGIRLLTSFHRLVDNLLLSKLVKRETTGGFFSSRNMFSMEKALRALLECVRLRDKSSVEILIETVKQNVCVKRLQAAFRDHLRRDQGAPLIMRPMLHHTYGREESGCRGRHAARPLQWLLHVISAILRESMRSERISLLLVEMSSATSAFHSASSTGKASSCTLNGGIGPAPKPILMEIIYDFFLEKFGTRWEAEKLIHDVFVNCRSFVESNSMAMLLSSLCCMSSASPDDRLMGQNEALAFLLGIFRSGLHTFRIINPPTIVVASKRAAGSDADDESSRSALEHRDWLPIELADSILSTAFNKLSADHKQRLRGRIEEAALSSHPGDMDTSVRSLHNASGDTQSIEAGAFLVLSLSEWKRYIVQRMNEVKVMCCAVEEEMHRFEEVSQLDVIARVLKKSSISHTNDDLCFVFRRLRFTEQRHADKKGDANTQHKNQEHISDRLAAACFPLLAREPLSELQHIGKSAIESFQLSPNPIQSYEFLVSSWSGYREQCRQLLDELRRIGKNNDIQAESFSHRVSSNRETLDSPSSTSPDRLSSRDVTQHEAVYLLFIERLERLADLFEKDRGTAAAGDSRRSSVNISDDGSLSLADELHSWVVMVNETWKIFRQVLLGFIQLRSLASIGEGTLPDEWSELQQQV